MRGFHDVVSRSVSPAALGVDTMGIYTSTASTHPYHFGVSPSAVDLSEALSPLYYDRLIGRLEAPLTH